MFLEHIEELGLLSHNPESDILGGFPLEVKCNMIAQMNRYLLSADSYEPAEVLTSPSHVNFSMELVGQGLDLPLHNISIITQSVNVYATWLLEPKKRPLSMIELGETSAEYQLFLQNIFKHLSLLFRPRLASEGQQQLPTTGAKQKDAPQQEDYTALFGQHLELCNRVLGQHFLLTLKSHSEVFNEETWIVLLKVLLGICDSLLSKPSRKTDTGSVMNISKNLTEYHDRDFVVGLMGDKLCETLIKTIFEVWIASKTMNVELWDKFKEHFMAWNFRVQMIQEWCAVTLTISQKVVADLVIKTPSIRSLSMPNIPEFNSEENCAKKTTGVVAHVLFQPFLDNSVVFDGPVKEPSYYCWHRAIYMLQNPVYLEPLNFQTAIHGISDLINVFLLFGRKGIEKEKDTYQESPVNGNTLLNMFGDWLFPAAAMFKSGYEIGRAEAISCLCKIFSQFQRVERFHQKYLEKFYSVISKALAGDFLSLCAVVKNSTHLFSLNLDGFRLLTPDYIKGLTRILPVVQATHTDLLGQKIDFDHLRRDAYTILSSTIYSLTILNSVPIPFNVSDISLNRVIEPTIHNWIDDWYPNTEVQTFESLKSVVIAMLLNSIIIESNQSNCKLLLSISSSFATQESKCTKQIYYIFIRVIQDMISLPDHWSQEVVLSAFEVLAYFSSVIDPETGGFDDAAKELSLSICHYVNSCLKGDNLVPLQQRVVKAFDVLSKWAIQGNWLLNNWSVQKTVISSITRGTVLMDRDSAYSVIGNISESAQLRPSIISHSTLAALGKLTDSFKLEINHASSNSMGSVSNSSSQAKKKQTVISLVPPKRFAKLRLSYAPSGGNLISTASKDGGIGLPTFAVISAEIQIKTAAERALQLICLRLGNFPSNGSCFGVTKLHSGWKEINKCAALTRLQNTLNDLPEPRFVFPEEYKFVHYFSYQKSLIFGLIELPPWSRQQSRDRQLVPSIAFITITPEGKYSWVGNFEYEEKYKDSNLNDHANLGSISSIISNAVDHSEIFEKWRGLIAAQKSSQSKRFSTIAGNKDHSWVSENIPSAIDCQLKDGADIDMKMIERAIGKHCSLEDDILNLSSKSRSFIAKPQTTSANVDPAYIPKVFRIFLSTLGLLDYPNRGSISALPITGSLLQDLEKLDDLPSRDCFTITVYYFKSVQDIADTIYKASEVISKEFEQFLWTLGWPVDVSKHCGYKGNLSTEATVPYFANMNMELIFRVPYLFKKDAISRSLSMLRGGLSKSSNSLASSIPSDPAILDDTNVNTKEKESRPVQTRVRQRSFTVASEKDVTAEPDSIAIVWLDDIHHVSQLADQLPLHIGMCVMIHPLQDSGALYLIRIMGKIGIPEDCLTVGPLVDQMIIGVDNIGSLIRTTAANIMKQFQISKNTYRRPHLTRRQFIEDMCHKHAISNNGLFTDLLGAR